MTKYITCTAIQQFKVRYVIPIDDVEDCDPYCDAETFIKDSVTCNEVNEFSQLDLGETIIDTQIFDENDILELFNTENEYLKSWSEEQKLDYIKRWFLCDGYTYVGEERQERYHEYMLRKSKEADDKIS
tara:strand:+ start:14155 stop:14541 length:387 start_codon:yes stop_codon:yes gene_type:complete